VDSDQAREVAAAWVNAWNGKDPEVVLRLLHAGAVINDVEKGKVRSPAVGKYVRMLFEVPERPRIRTWFSLPGVDSVAVVLNLSDGERVVQTLVVANAGRIVRVMDHRHVEPEPSDIVE
jgi:hypothetical protein